MHKEALEQIEYIKWFYHIYPNEICFMVRNDGSRTPREKITQKMMGLYPGVSDLVVPHLFLFIEMKADKKGRQSENQKKFQKYIELSELPYAYIVGYGAEDAKQKTLERERQVKILIQQIRGLCDSFKNAI